MTVVSGRQILGARERQEDSFRIIRQDETDPDTDLLILLADGMGGHVGGEVASRLVVEVFEKHCISLSRNPRPADRLLEALEAANAALRAQIRQEPGLAGMGSTLVAAMKLGTKLYWLSVGDSILYLKRDSTLRRLNADHSVYGELVEHVREGRLTLEEAEAHPKRNALRSAIIGDRISLVDCNVIPLQPRDVILVASDGLETLEDLRIAELLSQPDRADPRAMSADLLSAVELVGRPRQDNATVVAYRFDPSTKATSSTKSLFASGPARMAVPLGNVALVAGAGAIALSLGGIIYAIGWGGQNVDPGEIAGEGAVAPPGAEVEKPLDVPRRPSTIDRPQPETGGIANGETGQETPPKVAEGPPETVPPRTGELISPPDAVQIAPSDGAVTEPRNVVPEASVPAPAPAVPVDPTGGAGSPNPGPEATAPDATKVTPKGADDRNQTSTSQKGQAPLQVQPAPQPPHPYRAGD
jgi:PPM family protein phosphatase